MVPDRGTAQEMANHKDIDAAGAKTDRRVKMRKSLLLSLLLVPLGLSAQTPTLPSEREQKALVLKTLLAFHEAVQEKSFADFRREQLSPKFREQFSLEKFTAAFQPFIEGGYDISNIAESQPVFEVPPAIDDDEVLLLQGHYPTKPNKVSFRLRYVHGSSGWKLLGINVRAVPAVENTGEIPSEKEVKALVLESLLAFNTSVQAKSFTSFYRHIAELWRKETTAEKLQKIFQLFIDQELNLGPIDTMEPTFDAKPAINSDGFLVVKGSYPTKPRKVAFEVKYVYEETEWKLVGINVRLKESGEKTDTNDTLGKKTEKKSKEKSKGLQPPE